MRTESDNTFEYPLITPPFALDFRKMSKKQFVEYNEWYHKIMPERIQMLARAVKGTKGYEAWNPDYSPESLIALGEWFQSQVATRQRTSDEVQAEMERIKSPNIPIPLPVSEQTLTAKTVSLAMDIGFYLGQVFTTHHPSLHWLHVVSGVKASIDYGQPVLAGFGAEVFNPRHMVIVATFGIANKHHSGTRLKEIHDKWAKKIA